MKEHSNKRFHEASNSHEQDDNNENKYIIFSLGSTLYGAKLTEVREVVEHLPTKKVPNTVPSFQGVCNLRGQIIGVIDLRTHFHISSEPVERPVLLVFETDSGAIAATVDNIGAVMEIPTFDIETKPNIVSPISSKYIIGIAKHESEMIILLDLRSVLSHEELKNVEVLRDVAPAA